MRGLVEEQQVGASVPSPHPGLRAVRAIGELDNLAWTDLLKEAYHAGATGSAVDVDGQRCGLWADSRLEEPKEGVDRIALLNCWREGAWWKSNIDVVLFLREELALGL